MHIILGLLGIIITPIAFNNSKKETGIEKLITLVAGSVALIVGIGLLFNPHFKFF